MCYKKRFGFRKCKSSLCRPFQIWRASRGVLKRVRNLAIYWNHPRPPIIARIPDHIYVWDDWANMDEKVTFQSETELRGIYVHFAFLGLWDENYLFVCRRRGTLKHSTDTSLYQSHYPQRAGQDCTHPFSGGQPRDRLIRFEGHHDHERVCIL